MARLKRYRLPERNAAYEKILIGRAMLSKLLEHNSCVSDILVYIHLLSHLHFETQKVNEWNVVPEQMGQIWNVDAKYIMDSLHMPQTTVYRSLRNLEKSGMIAIEEDHIEIIAYEKLMTEQGFFELPPEIYNEDFLKLSKPAMGLLLRIFSQLSAQYATRKKTSKIFSIKTLLSYTPYKSYTQLSPIIEELKLFFDIVEIDSSDINQGVCCFIISAKHIFEAMELRKKLKKKDVPCRQKYKNKSAFLFYLTNKYQILLTSLKDLDDLISLYIDYGLRKIINALLYIKRKNILPVMELGAYVRSLVELNVV